jgi:hypothetical protein
VSGWLDAWIEAAIRRTARSFSALVVLGLLSTSGVPSLAAEDPLEALKVAFIYRFTNFVEWPDDRPEAPFLICVIADSGMGHALRVLVREAKAVAARPIRIRTGDARLAQSSCEILFIGRAAERRLADIVAKSAGKPTLLVGDTPGFAPRGVAIELFQKSNVLRNRLRLGFRTRSGIQSGKARWCDRMSPYSGWAESAWPAT